MSACALDRDVYTSETDVFGCRVRVNPTLIIISVRPGEPVRVRCVHALGLGLGLGLGLRVMYSPGRLRLELSLL